MGRGWGGLTTPLPKSRQKLPSQRNHASSNDYRVPDVMGGQVIGFRRLINSCYACSPETCQGGQVLTQMERQRTASLQENAKGPGPQLRPAKMLDTPWNTQEGENGFWGETHTYRPCVDVPKGKVGWSQRAGNPLERK